MRALAIDTDVIVVISAVWQTTATLVRSGDEGFLIDSPVLPEELEALPSLAEQAGFPVSGLLATHSDWDHVLGRLAYPDASLGVAESTAARLQAEPGEAQRALRRFDDRWYLDRPRPLRLGSVQALPVPGKLSIGSGGREIELHPAHGHTADGCAFRLPWCGVLVVGDYLSPVELPLGRDHAAYLETLERLRGLVAGADTVVPGHGHPMSGAEALRVLDGDLARLRDAPENLAGWESPTRRPRD
jgi:glyoxylase-like metal-dependent hydrolase (beta-lactamase superfamily II)